MSGKTLDVSSFAAFSTAKSILYTVYEYQGGCLTGCSSTIEINIQELDTGKKFELKSMWENVFNTHVKNPEIETVTCKITLFDLKGRSVSVPMCEPEESALKLIDFLKRNTQKAPQKSWSDFGPKGEMIIHRNKFGKNLNQLLLDSSIRNFDVGSYSFHAGELTI